MTRAHDAKVLDRIREIPALSDAVFDGDVPKTNPDGSPRERPQRYVNVHSNRGVARQDRLSNVGRRARKTFWIHSVGMNRSQADAIAERIIAKLHGWTPAVDGYSCERMTHESSQPTQKDETTKPALFFAVDVFDVYTTPIDPSA